MCSYHVPDALQYPIGECGSIDYSFGNSHTNAFGEALQASHWVALGDPFGLANNDSPAIVATQHESYAQLGRDHGRKWFGDSVSSRSSTRGWSFERRRIGLSI
jgi:hypothetical protein